MRRRRLSRRRSRRLFSKTAGRSRRRRHPMRGGIRL